MLRGTDGAVGAIVVEVVVVVDVVLVVEVEVEVDVDVVAVVVGTVVVVELVDDVWADATLLIKRAGTSSKPTPAMRRRRTRAERLEIGLRKMVLWKVSM
jgi:hypothetical protein